MVPVMDTHRAPVGVTNSYPRRFHPLASIVKDVVSTVVSNKEAAFSHRPALAVANETPDVIKNVRVITVIDCFMELGS